jgi:ribosomal subunit interface protein
MQIRLKGTKYEPTAEMTAQVEEKVGALARFIDESSAQAYASVELERAVGGMRNGDIWRAEVQITHESGDFRAESTKAKLDHALTTVVRDVARELSRAHKKRQVAARKRNGAMKSLLRGFGGK